MPVSSVLDDRYLLTERIGVGAFGEVRRARDQVLDRLVAVKLLHAGLAADDETLNRFRAEARHAACLSHENVAHVYDYGGPSPQHPPYLVMELIDGDSLAVVLRRGGALDVTQVLDIIAQAAAGLQAAHRAGLIHRDIKPANLLLSAAGVVKITDFGVAYAAGSAPVTRTGMIIGTPTYLAPERAAGAQATKATDLYALGVVAYECLAGSPPFAGTALEVMLAHQARSFPPLPASVPDEVARFISDLTATRPADRPASAADVATRARALHSQAATAAPPPAPGLLPDGPEPVTLLYPSSPTKVSPRLVPARWAFRRFKIGVRTGSIAVAVALIGMMFLVGANILGSATPLTATRVNVNGGAFVGEPVTVAVTQLEHLRLRVHVHWQLTSAQLPGNVVAIKPTGQLPAASLVTIVGARQPHRSDRANGHGHGHGHGNGGDGGGGGGGGN